MCGKRRRWDGGRKAGLARPVVCTVCEEEEFDLSEDRDEDMLGIATP